MAMDIALPSHLIHLALEFINHFRYAVQNDPSQRHKGAYKREQNHKQRRPIRKLTPVGEDPQKLQPHQNSRPGHQNPRSREVVERPSQLHIVQDLEQRLYAVAYRILGRGPLHIIAAVDGHLFDAQVVVPGLQEHLRAGGHIAVLDVNALNRSATVGPKAALAVGDVDPACDIGGDVQHLHAHFSIGRDVFAVAVAKAGAYHQIAAVVERREQLGDL